MLGFAETTTFSQTSNESDNRFFYIYFEVDLMKEDKTRKAYDEEDPIPNVMVSTTEGVAESLTSFTATIYYLQIIKP